MSKSTKHVRRMSFTQEVDTGDDQKSQNKKTPESTQTSPRMISKSQKISSPTKKTFLNKSPSEKQSEITAEVKSLHSRKSSSFSPENFRGEIHLVPIENLSSDQSQIANSPSPVPTLNKSNSEKIYEMTESLSTSPYRYRAMSSTTNASPAGSPNNDALTKEPISPLSPRMARQVSRSGVLKFDKLPEFYQELIKKNNGVITSPKDLAALFF